MLEARPLVGAPAEQIAGTIGKRVLFVQGGNRSRRGKGSGRPVRLSVTTGGGKAKPILTLRHEGARILGPYDPYLPTLERIVFAADDGIHGIEWWGSDGTKEGTQLLIDAMPGAASGVDQYDQPVRLDSGTTIVPIMDPEHGREWWRTDGTPDGTQLIKDINPGSNSSNGPFTSVDRLAVGDLMFFTAFESTGLGQEAELWRSDGTTQGTFSLKVRMSASGLKGGILGDELVFGDAHGALRTELYRSDGTVDGTVPYYDFPEAPMADPAPFGFGASLGQLFFIRRSTLWVTNNLSTSPRPLREYGAIFGSGGTDNQAAFGVAAGPALIYDVIEEPYSGEPFPVFTTSKWVSLGTPETTLRLSGILPPAAEPDSITTIGERALFTPRVGEKPMIYSTAGTKASLRRIRVGGGVDWLSVSSR